MSETEVKEQELVAGAIVGVIVKGQDKWQVEVRPDGSQYTKKLWTKDADLVGSVSSKIGDAGAFVCNVSLWTNNDGKQVRSLWIENAADGTENLPERVATPAAAAKAASNEGVDWDAKERRDYRSRAWAQTLGAFGHTIKVDEDPLAAFARLHPFQKAVYRDVVRGLFQPDDDDIPF